MDEYAAIPDLDLQEKYQELMDTIIRADIFNEIAKKVDDSHRDEVIDLAELFRTKADLISDDIHVSRSSNSCDETNFRQLLDMDTKIDEEMHSFSQKMGKNPELLEVYEVAVDKVENESKNLSVHYTDVSAHDIAESQERNSAPVLVIKRREEKELSEYHMYFN